MLGSLQRAYFSAASKQVYGRLFANFICMLFVSCTKFLKKCVSCLCSDLSYDCGHKLLQSGTRLKKKLEYSGTFSHPLETAPIITTSPRSVFTNAVKWEKYSNNVLLAEASFFFFFYNVHDTSVFSPSPPESEILFPKMSNNYFNPTSQIFLFEFPRVLVTFTDFPGCTTPLSPFCT